MDFKVGDKVEWVSRGVRLYGYVTYVSGAVVYVRVRNDGVHQVDLKKLSHAQ